MAKLIRSIVVMLLMMTLLTGVVYPLVVTGAAQWLFPAQARGSLIERDGQVIGSRLIGQSFADPRYFWGRPSATTPTPNNGTASGGSNLGPSNPALADVVKQRIEALHAVDPSNVAPVPVDLVTASASGLDPEISQAAAYYQVARVARMRHLDQARLRALVAASTQGRQLGVLGEPRTNVLQLNLALDALR